MTKEKNNNHTIRKKMKKHLLALLLGMMTIGMMTSCSKNSPSGTIEKYMKCLSNKDAKGIVELSYIDGIAKNAEELEIQLLASFGL